MTEVQKESDPWSLQAELRHAMPITVIPVNLINFTVPASQKKKRLESILACIFC